MPNLCAVQGCHFAGRIHHHTRQAAVGVQHQDGAALGRIGHGVPEVQVKADQRQDVHRVDAADPRGGCFELAVSLSAVQRDAAVKLSQYLDQHFVLQESSGPDFMVAVGVWVIQSSAYEKGTNSRLASLPDRGLAYQGREGNCSALFHLRPTLLIA